MRGSHGWRCPACCAFCPQNTCRWCCPCFPASTFSLQNVWNDWFSVGLHSDTWEDVFKIGGSASSKFCHHAQHNYSIVGMPMQVGKPVLADTSVAPVADGPGGQLGSPRLPVPSPRTMVTKATEAA
eukprot:gnl/TRDRNA2_/TRDRNA2_168315_c1_seq1.p1 gnl/TRDRNA2_/TRDRNA2_168315_c1~~gnl/TRDRNA2_/TRDRNA2_168315_c1_seq1.p1  ORF type:complete len:126 (-),score=13.98 gnl/TRDRNA2_/TRDRNA2_168315_c1_seq1:116-493(-)